MTPALSTDISRRTRGLRGRPRAQSADTLAAVVLGCVLLLLWQLAAVAGALSASLPSPLNLAAYLMEGLPQPAFWVAVSATVWAWMVGFAISLAVGVVVGLSAGLSTVFRALIDPLVEFFRPIPSVVYLPLVALIAGTTPVTAVILVVGGAVWPIILQATAGARDTDAVLRDTARAYGLTRWEVLRTCVLPSALPFIATGVRISGTMALIIVVSAELLVTGDGLGGAIALSYQTGSYNALFGLSLVAAALGLVLDQALGLIERRLLRWHPMHRVTS